MQTEITLQALLQCGAILMGIWGFYKVIMEIVKALNTRHDKEQKWDAYEKNLQEERDKIYEKYDAKLSELEAKIEENQCDTGARVQEIRADVMILTECMAAVLDGLKQLNCNGAVSDAKKTLDKYLVQRAYDK